MRIDSITVTFSDGRTVGARGGGYNAYAPAASGHPVLHHYLTKGNVYVAGGTLMRWLGAVTVSDWMWPTPCNGSCARQDG